MNQSSEVVSEQYNENGFNYENENDDDDIFYD
jgi:hypothetical protein